MSRRHGLLVLSGFLVAVFIVGPAWTTFYALMAISAFLAWRRPDQPARRWGLRLWWTQLAANALWSPLFFGLHWLGLALIEIGLLWLLVGATVVALRPVRGLAAGLLVPYLLWVSFAAALNAAIWQLNG
jgi:tryptophan-rich sensory protein